MSREWENSLNIASLSTGLERSILGYAGESLVIGRALVCGYNLFFKAWRDSKYDAVLDHAGSLFRIEIKQSREGKQLSVTSGGRSGQQINREVGSREEIVSTVDCDFLIGVHSLSGRCWVVPTEVIEILGKKALNVEALEDFNEAWGIFGVEEGSRLPNGMLTRLRTLPVADLTQIAKDLGLDCSPTISHRLGPRTEKRIDVPNDALSFQIWSALARLGKVAS